MTSERSYVTSHPWITFQVDLQRCDHFFWMRMGEARSKCDHINGVPLLPETARQLLQLYVSKGAHGTTSIEGNTLSEEQVLQLVDGTLKLPKSQEYLALEVNNVLRACNLIAADVKEGRSTYLSPERITLFNQMVLDGLELEQGVIPGEWRTYSVGVPGYLGAPAEDCAYLVGRLCEWLNGSDFAASADDSGQMVFFKTLLKALVAHLYIAWIHPFGDGNGRTARLIEVEVLLQSGLVSMPAAHLLSNHYNLTRTQYYRELDRASKSGGDVTGFLEYALQGFVDGLVQQLDVIREQQRDVTWRNFVHEEFKGRDTIANIRRRHLVLDMPKGTTHRAELTRVSVRVAEEYAGKGPRTLARDLNALRVMRLVLREGPYFMPNSDVIEAFLPVRAACDYPLKEGVQLELADAHT
jgi:Fic family protein